MEKIKYKWDIIEFENKINSINAFWYRDPEKIAKLIKDKILAPKYQEILENIIPILDLCYPDHWDISLSFPGKYLRTRELLEEIYSIVWTIDVAIHYPRVKVANQAGKFHTITDMIVHIPIFLIDGKPYINFPHGNRFSYSAREVLSGYIFSHLGSRLTSDFKHFCLGEGEIRMTLGVFNANTEWEMFQLLILQFEAYVAWESKDGGAYTYFESVEIPENTPANNTLNYSMMSRGILTRITDDNMDVPVDVLWDGHTMSIRERSEFDTFLLEIFKETYPDSSTQRDVIGRMVRNTYFTPLSTEVNFNEVKRKLKDLTLYYRGEMHPFILNEEVPVTQNYELCIHPNLKKNVKSELESRLKKGFRKKYIIERYNNPSNT